MRRLMCAALMCIAPAMGMAQEESDGFPACAALAAVEQNVPVDVFEALARGVNLIGNRPPNLHGPMMLNAMIIPVAAEGIGEDPDKIASDPCTNYRAAAWLLMNIAGEKDDKIWDKVRVYIYGQKERSEYPLLDRVKEMHEKISDA